MLEHDFHTPLPLTLDVSIPSGDVEIETVDGEETHLVVDGDEHLLEQVEIRHENNRVVVTMRGKSKIGFAFSLGSIVFGDSNSLSVQARVPHGADLAVKTASADVRIDGQVGRIETNTASGDVRARGLAGEAKVKTVSGDVQLDRVGGDVSVQTVSGDLRVGGADGDIDAKSVSGDIRLDSLRAGDAKFASVSGDVEIGVAAGSNLDVDAGSTSGDLSSEVPLGSEPAHGDGDGSPTVVIRGRTVSGDVKVFRAA